MNHGRPTDLCGASEGLQQPTLLVSVVGVEILRPEEIPGCLSPLPHRGTVDRCPVVVGLSFVPYVQYVAVCT